MIGGGDGFDPLAGKFREVLGGHRTVMGLGTIENAFGDGAFVKRFWTVFGNLLQRPRDIGVAKYFAGARRAAIRQEGLGSVGITAQLRRTGSPIAGKNLRHGKSFIRIANRRSEECRKFLAPKAVAKLVPTIDCARNSYGIDAVGGHSGNAFGFQKFRREIGRRPTARIETVEFSRLGLIDDSEQ